MKKFKLFKTLLVLIVLITSINTVLADQHVWNAWVKCDFNGSGKWTTDDGWQFNPTMSTGTLEDLGTLTSGKFTITSLKWKCAHNWETWPTKAYAYMWYKINDGEAQHSSGQYYGNPGTEFYPYSGTIAWDIANYTDPSGSYTFTCGFYCHFHWNDAGYNNDNLDNGGNNYKFTYKVAPPACSGMTISQTGKLAGTGTSADPYIVAYNGSLQLDMSAATQKHTDANSSAQYSIDDSSYGTETANTRKTISSITSTSTQSVHLYAKFYNSTASLSGTVKDTIIYYRAEDQYYVTATVSEGGTSPSPSVATLAGQYSGYSISASAQTGYYFTGWTVESGTADFESASSLSTKVYPSADAVVKANFRPIWYLKGDFNTWGEANPLSLASATSGSATLVTESTDLEDSKFKIWNKQTDTYYQIANAEVSRAASSPSGAWTSGGEDNDMLFNSDVIGTYTFNVTFTSNIPSALSVSYPSKHAITYGAGAINGSSTAISVSPSFSSGADVADETAVTFSKGSTTEGYVWKGWYSNNDGSGTEHSTTDGNWTSAASTRSADLSVYACYTYRKYDITYKDKDNATYSGDKTDGVPTGAPTKHTYNTATDLVKGTKTGYVFEGWYTSSACTGDPVTSISASTTGNQTLYAKWTDAATVAADCWDKGEYKCGGIENFDTPDPDATSWDAPASWGAREVPNINTQVVLTGSMNIEGDAIAKEVILPSDKKLDIVAGGSLIVANTIQLSSGSAPSSSNIEISSSLSGNAALIWGANASISADVEFTTLSHGSMGSKASVNQYIGVPTSTNVSTYTDTWVFQIAYDGATPYWEDMESGTMVPWKGYCIISNSNDDGRGYTISGSLTNSNASPSLVYNGSKTENVLANSWTAPIRIGAFENSDFTNVDAAIYIFNSCSLESLGDDPDPKGMGFYSSFTPGEKGTNVIPSMQSFSVLANDNSPSISLDYKKLVYNPAVDDAVRNHANYAPKHQKDEDMTALKMFVQSESGWADELKIYERSDFSTEFEKGRDAYKLYGDPSAPLLYCVGTDGELAINFVPNVNNLPIGFRTGTASKEYTFSFKYDGDDELVLKDTKTEIETPIDNESTYNFTSSPEDNDLRFVVIKKTPQVVTGVESISEGSNVQKIMHNGAMYIVRDGKIYSVDGSLVK